MPLTAVLLLLILQVREHLAQYNSELSPTLQCVCSSTHFEDTTFAVKCQRNSSGEWNLQADNQVPNWASMEPVFVERSTVSCTRGVPPAPGKDYTYVHGLGFYKLHKEIRSWEEAVKTCAQEGALLAVINSQEEADLLERIMKENPNLHEEKWINNQAWLGLNDLKEEGKYATLSGVPLEKVGWAKWSPDEPNDRDGNEDCVTFVRTGTLNDLPCPYALPFFCERQR